MKPPEDAKTRIVNEWRRKADVDLAVAGRLLSDETVLLNAVTFHCQQVAEKYLKALLTYWNIEFPKTHVLAKLIGLIETRDAALAMSLLDAVALTPDLSAGGRGRTAQGHPRLRNASSFDG